MEKHYIYFELWKEKRTLLILSKAYKVTKNIVFFFIAL